MIKSMTAFSQASNTHDTVTANVTIRSYNSRHLDIKLYTPESCQPFEENIKKIITKIHERGRIEIKLSIQDDAKDQDLFEVNEARVKSYFQAVEKIKKNLNLSVDISMDNILTARDVIVPLKKDQDADNLWNAVAPCIEAASVNLNAMRKEEGRNLYKDLIERVDYIEDRLKFVKKEADTIPMLYKQKLMEKISGLTLEVKELDPVRIAQEAAIIADKSDVSEEIVRLYSHTKLFRDTLDSDASQGRKLIFLIQEFNRELNTIGSKAGSAPLSHMIVDLKSQLEKIREQIHNIE